MRTVGAGVGSVRISVCALCSLLREMDVSARQIRALCDTRQ
jgi:hypothetical protein